MGNLGLVAIGDGRPEFWALATCNKMKHCTSVDWIRIQSKQEWLLGLAPLMRHPPPVQRQSSHDVMMLLI